MTTMEELVAREVLSVSSDGWRGNAPSRLQGIDGYVVEPEDGGWRLVHYRLHIDTLGQPHEAEKVGVVDPRSSMVPRAIYGIDLASRINQADDTVLAALLAELRDRVGDRVLTDERELYVRARNLAPILVSKTTAEAAMAA